MKFKFLFHVSCAALAAGITACQTAEPVKPVAAAAAPAPKPIATPAPAAPAAPGIAWGEPVNGLRAGVEFAPNQGQYDLGQCVAVRFHLQNVGTKPITLLSSKVRQDFASATDGSGNALGVYTEKFLGKHDVQQIALAPGETKSLQANRIGFGEVDRRAVQLSTGERMGSMVHCGSGGCKVQYRLRFPDFVKRAADKDVSAAGSWQGELTTGSCAVNIR